MVDSAPVLKERLRGSTESNKDEQNNFQIEDTQTSL
jgi:hypothetical protein